MHIDVKITLISDKLAEFGIQNECVVTIDNDYIEDYDDVISEIETELWNKYSKNISYNVDFEIDPDTAETICEEFFN